MSNAKREIRAWQKSLTYVLPILLCALLIIFGQKEVPSNSKVPANATVTKGKAIFSPTAVLNYLSLNGFSLQEGGILYYDHDVPAGEISWEAQNGVIENLCYTNMVIFNPELAKDSDIYDDLVEMQQQDKDIAVLLCRSVLEALGASKKLTSKSPGLVEEKLLKCLTTGKTTSHKAGGMLFHFSLAEDQGVGYFTMSLVPQE